MMYLSNAFSLNMLPPLEQSTGRHYSPTCACHVEVTRLSKQRAIEILTRDDEYVSVVGHADTAAVMQQQLGLPVDFNRVSLTLKKGDFLVVGQYSGPRLPEGATALPEGADFSWLAVYIS